MNSGSGWPWIRRRTPRVVLSLATRAISGSIAAATLERQADDGAEHAAVLGGESVHPLGFVEILRHVDVDFDEDEAFDLVGFRPIGEIVHGPVALERRRVLRPGIAESFLIEEMDVGIDDRKIDHAERLPA